MFLELLENLEVRALGMTKYRYPCTNEELNFYIPVLPLGTATGTFGGSFSPISRYSESNRVLCIFFFFFFFSLFFSCSLILDLLIPTYL
ncbi:hypothetical protein F4811DRAFT_267204 [Daldinia bambusicola]|nr:hypothetical protein F4811DRAFT_267204 [Daldinia bambusicola]